MIASSLDDDPLSLIENSAIKENILPFVVIYGSNASGKSNLLHSLNDMRWSVLFSHSRNEPSANLPFNPFALDPDCLEGATVFDIDFVVNGVRYHYGFEQTRKTFNREWLYSFPSGSRRKLFLITPTSPPKWRKPLPYLKKSHGRGEGDGP